METLASVHASENSAKTFGEITEDSLALFFEAVSSERAEIKPKKAH